MPVQVYYNNNLIGEPFISKSYSPMDFGNRWGMTETITLNGYVDPLNGVSTQIKQDHNNVNYTEKTMEKSMESQTCLKKILNLFKFMIIMFY